MEYTYLLFNNVLKFFSEPKVWIFTKQQNYKTRLVKKNRRTNRPIDVVFVFHSKDQQNQFVAPQKKKYKNTDNCQGTIEKDRQDMDFFIKIAEFRTKILNKYSLISNMDFT